MARLVERASRGIRTLRDLSRLRYSTVERINLIFALRRGDKDIAADVLGYHVSFLNPPLFRSALRKIFIRGEYIFEAATDSPVIFDCGAGIGLATLYFKRLYPRAQIICFEAHPPTAEVLAINIEQNQLQGVAVHNLRLSRVEDDRLFSEADPSRSPNSARFRDGRVVRAPAALLSSHINGDIDLLRLDVGGAELDVISDLIESGEIARIRRMVIEFHHNLESEPSRLSYFLALLERSGFDYQLSARSEPVSKRHEPQTVLIGACRYRF